MEDQNNILIKLVTSDSDVETLRVIRNSCRNFMTRQTHEIDKDSQMMWWQKLDKTIKMKCSKCGFEHEIYFEGLESFFD